MNHPQSPTPKILFIDQYSQMGGGQTVLLQMAQVALAHGSIIQVMAPAEGPLKNEVLALPNATWLSLPALQLTSGKKDIRDAWKFGIFMIRSFFKLRSEMKRFDKVVVNGVRISPLVAFAGMGSRNKIDYHIHLEHSLKLKKWFRFLAHLKSTKNIIFASQFLYSSYAKVLGKPLAKEILLENALSEKWTHLPFHPQNRNDDVLRVACVGRISEEKGQDILIGAAANLQKIEIYLLGASDFADPSYMETLERNKPENVHFVGKTKGVLESLRELNINVCVAPSKKEAFGLAVIESQAASCVGVVSGVEGLMEVARTTGSIIASSAPELRRTLIELQQMPAQELNSIAQAQWQKTRDHYPQKTFATKWWAIINK